MTGTASLSLNKLRVYPEKPEVIFYETAQACNIGLIHDQQWFDINCGIWTPTHASLKINLGKLTPKYPVSPGTYPLYRQHLFSGVPKQYAKLEVVRNCPRVITNARQKHVMMMKGMTKGIWKWCGGNVKGGRHDLPFLYLVGWWGKKEKKKRERITWETCSREFVGRASGPALSHYHLQGIFTSPALSIYFCSLRSWNLTAETLLFESFELVLRRYCEWDSPSFSTSLPTYLLHLSSLLLSALTNPCRPNIRQFQVPSDTPSVVSRYR